MTSNHIENEETINIEEGEIEVPKLNLSSFSCEKDILLSEGKEDEEEGKEDDDEKAEEHHKTIKVARKIEPSTQFGDLKTNHHSTKMTLIESFTDMINKEIVRFANEIHDVYPEVPVDGLLAIWCKQQNLPASTFNLSELELDPYACDTDVDEPAKKAEKKKKKSPKTKQLTPPASDAEDDVPSEDEEPEHGKKKKQPKKEKKEKVADTLKVCLHRFVKGKNANTQCTIKVKGEGDFCSKHKEKKAK